MKRSLLGVVAAAVIVVGTAPSATAITWELGAKAGINGATMRGDFSADRIAVSIPGVGSLTGDFSERRPGFVGGAFVLVGINNYFGVQVEALYSQKGSKADISGTALGNSFTGEGTLELDYFDVPILAVLSAPAGEKARIGVLAGFSLGFSTSAKVVIDATVNTTPLSFTQDLDNVKSADFGGVLGGFVSVAAGQVDLVFDGRWTFGFTSVDDGILATGEELDIKNSVISFTVGVGYPFGRVSTE